MARTPAAQKILSGNCPKAICVECGSEFFKIQTDKVRCSTKCNYRAFKKRKASQEWPELKAKSFDELPPAFLEKVTKTDECFMWSGNYEKSTGYGIFYWHGKSRRVHVLVYKWLKSEPPKYPGVIDHKCGNRLCVNPNHLRLASQQQNAANRADKKKWKNRFIGIHWRERDRNWTAKLRHNYKYYYAGPFKNEVDAAKAYNEMALRLNGQFAALNPIPQDMSHAV